MLNVSNAVSQSDCNFKGSLKKTDKGTDYYNTNSAIKIGAPLAGLAALGTGYNYYSNSATKNLLKNLPSDLAADVLKDIKSSLKQNKKFILLSGLTAIVGHLGISSYIDYKRNQKAKEIADLAKNNNVEALKSEQQVTISKNGKVCLNSNTGAKLGGWLGAAYGLLMGSISAIHSNKQQKDIMNSIGKDIPNEIKQILSKSGKVGSFIGIAIGSLGAALIGWLLGKWSDHIANKDTYKNA